MESSTIRLLFPRVPPCAVRLQVLHHRKLALSSFPQRHPGVAFPAVPIEPSYVL